jgi:N-acetylmuramoyl-L-alanine amidase
VVVVGAPAVCFVIAGCGGASRDGATAAQPVTAVSAQSAPSAPSAPSAAVQTVPTLPAAPSSPPRPAAGGPGRAGRPLTLHGKTVVIDPGHNGGNASDPRAINRLVPAGGFEKPCDTTGTETLSGYTEASFNLDVSRRLAHLLRHEGAHVVLTRTDNSGVGPCVNDRAAIGNRAHADAAISIHADSFDSSGHGFHVIEPALVAGYTERIVGPSATLGRILRDAMAASSGLSVSNYLGHDGIDVRGDLGGLNLSHVPKVFLENGNMQNPHDAGLQVSSAWRQRLAGVIERVLRKFLTGAG